MIRRTGRTAQVHGLGAAHPHRLGWIPGVFPGLAAHHPGRRRHLSLPCGRAENLYGPGGEHAHPVQTWVPPLPWRSTNAWKIPPPGSTPSASCDRTVRWLVRCKAEMARLNALPGTVNPHQLLFGINQGCVYEDLRIEHIESRSPSWIWTATPSAALRWAKPPEDMYRIISTRWNPSMPADKPRYLMGVGTPGNILEAVARGSGSVRLRHAQPQRPPRACKHLERHSQPDERQIRRRPAPDR